MKNKELFEKTVNILVNAYLDDMLINRVSTKCAVGNLISANCKYSADKFFGYNYFVDENDFYFKPEWTNVFITSSNFFGLIQSKKFKIDNYNGEAKRQIDSTGYTPHELAQIENTFEKGCRFAKFKKNTIFNGLMKVLDILMVIHEANEEELTQTKKLFEYEKSGTF